MTSVSQNEAPHAANHFISSSAVHGSASNGISMDGVCMYSVCRSVVRRRLLGGDTKGGLEAYRERILWKTDNQITGFDPPQKRMKK